MNVIKKITVPSEVWDELIAKAIQEGFVNKEEGKREYGMAKFIGYICKEYLKGFPSLAKAREERPDPRVERFETLVKQQQEFLARLELMLRTAAKQEPNAESPTKAAAVMAVLRDSPRQKMHEIQQKTRIREEELLVLLGHLYTQGRIGFDEQWRYYAL